MRRKYEGKHRKNELVTTELSTSYALKTVKVKCQQPDCEDIKMVSSNLIKGIVILAGEAIVSTLSDRKDGCLRSDCGTKPCQGEALNPSDVDWLKANVSPLMLAGEVQFVDTQFEQGI
jgi:hypothetical protein